MKRSKSNNPDCDECGGSGEVLAVPALQAYSSTRGTYIEDEKYEPCPKCTAPKDPPEPDDER